MFSGPSTQVAQAATNALGGYEIKDTDLAAGTYRVRVGDEWYGPGATDYASAAPVTVTAGSPTRLDLTLTDAADVTGTVVDANHDPAPGTLVVAYDGSSQIVTLAVTGADGTFDLGVPAGATITIKVADSAHPVDSAHPLVTLGGVTPTQITTTAGSNDIGTLTIIDTTQIAAGNGHTCALETDHTVECWGYNGNGQLGNGTTTDSNVPVPVSNLNDATAIAAGGYHLTCALETDHTVACWGFNGDGQLGNGTTTDSNVPVSVSNLNDATAITASGNHTCALKTDHTVACWGDNGEGELGNGTNTSSNVPVSVSNLDDATAITAGHYHTCALKTDHTVACWGNNSFGELGDGTNTSSNVPVPVSGLDDATAITAAGGDHTCALKADHTVACWGNNSYGQLGNGTNTSSNVPVPVSGLDDATAIAAGDILTCALKADHTVACWGNNYAGQLGNGTTTDSNVPVPVSGLDDATAITANYEHTCALKADHTVACWGNNYAGQLGNGTTTDSSVPVLTLGIPYATIITP